VKRFRNKVHLYGDKFLCWNSTTRVRNETELPEIHFDPRHDWIAEAARQDMDGLEHMQRHMDTRRCRLEGAA
jgi:hypothetical protein